ncbi:MAG: hypothetical protein AB8E15_07490, partial [Bdellovibrionales bacterium]
MALEELCRCYGIGSWQRMLDSKRLPGKTRSQLV